jgi:outer membrane lipopolysaccharide assembly protein LptE/RlpB
LKPNLVALLHARGVIKPPPLAGFLLIVLVGLCSCGYQFAGSGSLPQGVEKIFITVLENKTTEAGIENQVTNALVYEFTRNQQDLASEANEADAILKGSVTSLVTTTISRQGERTSKERRIILTVDLALVKPDDKAIWNAKGIQADKTYLSGDDEAVSGNNRREALTLAAQRLAEDVYNRMTDDF